MLSLITALIAKVRYNIYSALQLVASAVNTILLIYVFGKSDKTAAFYISTNIVIILNLFSNTSFDQFINFYIGRRKTSPDEADALYRRSLAAAAAVGAVFAVLAGVFAVTTLTIFATNLTAEQVPLSAALVETLVGAIFAAPLSTVIQARLAADGHIGTSYLVATVPPLVQSVATLALTLVALDVTVLGLAISIGNLCALAIGLRFATPHRAATAAEPDGAEAARRAIGATTRNVAVLYAAALLVLMIVVPSVLHALPLSSAETIFAGTTVAALIVCAVLISLEIPFATVISIRRLSWPFYLSNTLFAIAFVVLTTAPLPLDPAARLAIALTLPQTIVFVNNRRRALAALRASEAASEAEARPT